MFKFCPNCTKETQSGWKCCPYCGYKFEEVNSAAPQEVGTGAALDDALINLVGFANEKQADAQKRDRLRVMIIRGQYDEARAVCNELIDSDPMDMVGYIGLIRIASNNFKEFEGDELNEQIRIVEEVFAGSDKLESDPEYAKYIVVRKKYFENKAAAEVERKHKQKEAEEAERIREAKNFEIISGCLIKYRGNAANVVIPDGVTSIGDRAFNGCGCLTSVTIPNGVTSIGTAVFADCGSLTSITIPYTVTSIGGGAFRNCRGLTSVVIPNGVRSIGEQAFVNCSSLTSIVIPDSVTSIGGCAFWDCSRLVNASVPSNCYYTYGTFPPDTCKVTRR